jgi:hypothetical protein
MTCEEWDTSANTWTAITIPASPAATCIDTETSMDNRGNTCADYAANPDDSSIIDCSGGQNVAGFVAATDCCACGGGSRTCGDSDGGLTDANSNTCADYTANSWTSTSNW